MSEIKQTLTSNLALKEFISLNKKFAEFLKSINKMLKNNEVSSATAQLGLVESYTASIAQIRKSLPKKFEVEKSKLYDELAAQQKKLEILIKENERLFLIQLNVSKYMSDYLTKQYSEKVRSDTAYSKDGSIAINGKYFESFAISDKI